MKAVQFFEHGDYDKLKIVELDKPTLKDGQLLVRVTYSAVNPVDNVLRKGGIKGPIKLPKILGDEGAGVVETGNDRFPAGTRVIISCRNAEGTVRGISSDGAWQEYIAAYPYELMRTPENIDDETAAALPVGFISAYACLTEAGFRPGDRVLALAVGGAVGNAAIQLARAWGASQVITTAGSAKKAEEAAQRGFENVIDLTKESVAEGVARLTNGQGVNIVVDMLGGPITTQAIAALAKFGTLVGIGYSAGNEFSANMTDFVWKGITVKGVSLSNWPDISKHEKAAESLMVLLKAGKIKPFVSKVFPIDEIGEANRYLVEERPFGKVLVKF